MKEKTASSTAFRPKHVTTQETTRRHSPEKNPSTYRRRENVKSQGNAIQTSTFIVHPHTKRNQLTVETSVEGGGWIMF
jgi:hypothetical protein